MKRDFGLMKKLLSEYKETGRFNRELSQLECFNLKYLIDEGYALGDYYIRQDGILRVFVSRIIGKGHKTLETLE